MAEIFSLLGGILDLRLLAIALTAVVAVLAAGYLVARNKKSRRQKPGQFMEYTAPGKTTADCRGLLQKEQDEDALHYEFTPAKGGGWHLHITEYRPTEQICDTLYLVEFTGEEPARFTLTFMREAFGMREPLVGPAILDGFFAQKLGAARAVEGETNEPA